MKEKWFIGLIVSLLVLWMTYAITINPHEAIKLITTQQAENICQASVAYCYDSVATVMCIRSLEACKLASEMSR